MEDLVGQKMIERLVCSIEKMTPARQQDILSLLARFASGNSAKLALRLASELKTAA